MAPLQTVAGRALRRTSTASTVLVFAVLTGSALAAGLASWASRPEAWSLGAGLPIRGSLAWLGAAAPVLAPVTVLGGAFLAARAVARRGEADAWAALGIGPARRWWATAPLWGLLAALALLWTGWVEPAAWAETIRLREAVASAPAHAVALPDGGVALRDGGVVRIRTSGAVAALHAFDASTATAGPVVVEGPGGTWTARRVELRRREAAPPRSTPRLAADLGELLGRASADPRAAALLHRRASLPVLLLLFSLSGWGLGSATGTLRRGDRRAAPALTGLLIVTFAGGRLADGVAWVPPWLLGWTPVLLAAVLLAGGVRYARGLR